MADHPEQDGPSLELPSLGRKRRQKKLDATSPEPAADETSAESTAPADSPATPAEAADPIEAGPTGADDDATEVLPATPAPAASSRPRWDTPAPAAEPSIPAPPIFADEVPVTTHTTTAVDDAPSSDSDDEQDDAAAERGPAVSGMVGAVLTGLLIGAATVGLTWGSLHLCEVIQGTSSCGNPGYLLLLAILAAMVLLGTQLLKMFKIPDAPSTSFLAIGLLAVLALLFLINVLLSWTMIIIIPLFSMATFALAHWVTTSFVEDDA